MAIELTPQNRRKISDHNRMVALAGRSDLISFEVIDHSPNMPPDKYKVTYKCKGIKGIDDNQEPIYAELHQVEIYLHADYPKKQPQMRCLTPVWHPNIEHKEPHRPCINPAWWAANRTLDSICIMIGEMIQYKNYHAKNEPPYPYDGEAAKWVRDWAEPKGILSIDKPVDTRELLRPKRVDVNLKSTGKITVNPRAGNKIRIISKS